MVAKPRGNRGVTVVFRKSSHSSGSTTPLGFAVPNPSDSCTARTDAPAQSRVKQKQEVQGDHTREVKTLHPTGALDKNSGEVG